MKRSSRLAVALLAMTVVAVPTAARAASSSPASVDFGTVHVGSTSTVPVQITVDPLYTVDSLGISKDTRDFTSDGGTCQGALGPVTCDASVTFQPLAGGSLSGTLGMQECTSTIDGPVCQELSVPLQGTGESDFSITPGSHDFGSILLGTTHTVDLTVTLDPGLEYRDEGAVEPPFSGDISDCVGKVGPATCTVTESVTLFLKGLQGGAVSMSECRQAPPLECSPEIGAGFSATGVSVFAVSPTSADFGDVETGQTATIDLSITRDANYTGGELNSLTAPFSSVTDGCGTDCDTVSFTPTTAGSWNQTLEITEIPSSGACSGLHCPEFTIYVGVSGTGIQDPGITAAGVKANLTEGAAFDGTVATFVDPDPSATPAEYSASIDWGDGTVTTGTITLTNGVFSVGGAHTYSEEGDDTITTTVADVDLSSNTVQATSTAAVGDAALSATAKRLFSTTGFNGVVAHFTDEDPGGTLSDYSATIDWGDGATSAGTVSAASGGGFDVSGSHTYAGLCACSITVTVDDTGGASTTVTDDMVVFSYLARGAFVVGNADATQNATVTWWSPKWSSANPLTGGVAPSSFKGFASGLSATPPAAGGTWSTTGGQSATPPTTVPTYMAVLVTSKVRKTSTTLSGPVTEVAVVRVLPGYDPSMGSPGTGVLLGFLP